MYSQGIFLTLSISMIAWLFLKKRRKTKLFYASLNPCMKINSNAKKIEQNNYIPFLGVLVFRSTKNFSLVSTENDQSRDKTCIISHFVLKDKNLS